MNSISLCMIVKNEEDSIARCLDCVFDIVDEIIVVDTGSSDSTKSILKGYTNKIHDFEWVEDFSAARNFSFSKATCDYILWLDADDIILESDRKELKSLKQDLDPSVDIVMMKYNVAFDEHNNPTFSYYRERLLKRSREYSWVGPIHEVITPVGNVVYSDIAICHKKLRPGDPERNLRIFEKMIKEGQELDQRQKFYYARELFYNERFREAMEGFIEFLHSGEGWIEDNISACRDLAVCYYQLDDEKSALRALFYSLEFDEPRAEVCCDIGKHFLDRGNYKTAAFWYLVALTRDMDENGGFMLNDCYGYIPNIQLCVCFDRLGDIDLAMKYNKKALLLKPGDAAALYNERYFKTQIEAELTQ